MRLPRLSELLLVAMSILLALAVMEGAARLLMEPSEKANVVRLVRDIRIEPTIPDVPHQLKPNGRLVQRYPSDPRGYFDRGGTLSYRINSLGFRGAETTWHKPPGTLRIVGLGDSFTFGIGVRRSDTFLALLEEGLAAKLPEARIEVLNLGVGGYGTAHEVSLLRHVGLRLDPDIVLLVHFLNDAGEARTLRFFSDRETKRPWWRASRLVDRLAVNLERKWAAERLVRTWALDYRDDAPGWVEARAALAEAAELARQRGFQLVVAIFPVLWQLSDAYPFEEIHRTIAREVESHGLPVLDLLPAFAGHDGPELWVHPLDQHPNERAHALVARALLDFLSQQGMLEPAASDDTAHEEDPSSV